MIICKTCGKHFDDACLSNDLNNLTFRNLEVHTKETGHHNYKIQGLNMELSVG